MIGNVCYYCRNEWREAAGESGIDSPPFRWTYLVSTS